MKLIFLIVFLLRCPVDSTTRMEPSPSRQKQRFSVEAFKFVGDFPFVYLHCSVIVCKANDSNSRCAKGCVPGLNVNPPVSSDEPEKSPARIKRASPETIAHTYLLSRGPFALSSSKELPVIPMDGPREDQAEGADAKEQNVKEVKEESGKGRAQRTVIQTDRQTERQREKQRKTDRQTDRRGDNKTDRYVNKQIN